MLKNRLSPAEKQEAQEKSGELLDLCIRFLTPLLEKLHLQLDIRLVNTFVDLVQLIMIHRDRHQGLILSELGGELWGEAHAPAGSKRIGNLLRSKRLERSTNSGGIMAVRGCKGRTTELLE